MNTTVKVRLLGRDYLLRSQGDPEQIQRAATLVEEKLAGLSDTVSVDTRDRFMLALLNLAGEYLQVRSRCGVLESEVQALNERQIACDADLARLEERLVERIEAALDE